MRIDCVLMSSVFFFQAEDGIRYLVRSRGLGDVYKRQGETHDQDSAFHPDRVPLRRGTGIRAGRGPVHHPGCLLYTSDAADERSSVDLGGRRIIKQQTNEQHTH